MASLNHDLILLIAEVLPLKDLRSLMATSRDHYTLIKAYERSIAKTRISRLMPLAAFCPLSSPIRSTKDFPRPLLAPATFDAVEELEHRARCADDLLCVGSQFLDAIPLLTPFHGLTPRQMDRLVARIRGTLTIVDYIADREAAVRKANLAKPFPLIRGDDPRLDSAATLAAYIHAARLQVIRKLSRLDLAFLFLICFLADTTWMTRTRRRGIQRPILEVLLGQGTVFLHDLFVHPSYPLGSFGDYIGMLGPYQYEVRFQQAIIAMWDHNSNWLRLKPLFKVIKDRFPAKEVLRLYLEERKKETQAFWKDFDENDDSDDRWLLRIDTTEEQEFEKGLEDLKENDFNDRLVGSHPDFCNGRFWLIRRWIETGEE
ncbi:hypothetical protein N658DRAFT_303034 [Parathielavia hyrcaniae]|uniref:Uncharacterized protein n=1 Tax=Parathielavia hyrcaniae TaxID=113614 RepID=A0AAN6T383_9PEZI|nr:hypothetical protein N658DRAFT_303034 [Parathielavia hyrcaniae]